VKIKSITKQDPETNKQHFGIFYYTQDDMELTDDNIEWFEDEFARNWELALMLEDGEDE
jgi:hypothetical protein